MTSLNSKARWFKLNVDAIVFANKGMVRFGCVLRGSNGKIISAKASSRKLQLQPHGAEAMSIREALTWIKQNNMSNIIVGIDAQLVYEALQSSTKSNSPFGFLIKDCRELMSIIDYVMLYSVRRSANSIAYYVARVSSSMSGHFIWTNLVPCFLLNNVIVDIN